MKVAKYKGTIFFPGVLVKIGKKKHKIVAVGNLGGERYYWLIDRQGTISMFPATIVEPAMRP